LWDRRLIRGADLCHDALDESHRQHSGISCYQGTSCASICYLAGLPSIARWANFLLGEDSLTLPRKPRESSDPPRKRLRHARSPGSTRPPAGWASQEEIAAPASCSASGDKHVEQKVRRPRGSSVKRALHMLDELRCRGRVLASDRQDRRSRPWTLPLGGGASVGQPPAEGIIGDHA